MTRKRTVGFVQRFASRLRFPYLLVLTISLLVVDLAVPDIVPFIDEVVLSLLAITFASIKKKRLTSSSSTTEPGTDSAAE